MNGLLNVSSAPHIRSRLTTGKVMYDVILALMPATVFGVYLYGLHAFLIIGTSIVSAVLAEFVFDFICHKPNTLSDGSAIVTGLLLALTLPPTVPLYVPYLGALFAIIFVKCVFGGLGQNIMNPALAGRCFLLISFAGVMSDYAVDGVSSATPLAVLNSGGTIDVLELFLGFGGGVIGVSGAALLIGGLFLLLNGTITWHLPVSLILSFAVSMGLGGPGGFHPLYLLAEVCGGGILMAAFFMANDPVTSPVTVRGQVVYGIAIGILAAVLRIYGSAADNVSYAIILCNLTVPLIDRVAIPKPFGLGDNAKKPKPKLPKAAVVLMIIALISGVALGAVNYITAPAIEAQALAANAASYEAVLPGAEDIGYEAEVTAVLNSLDGTEFGRNTINEAVVGTDASGNVVGCAINVTNSQAFDGTLSLSVGIAPDGTILGIAFTELNETPGKGMLCDEPAFKDQFAGIQANSIALGSDVEAVSGATVSSNSVVSAVNAALAFYNEYLK